MRCVVLSSSNTGKLIFELFVRRCDQYDAGKLQHQSDDEWERGAQDSHADGWLQRWRDGFRFRLRNRAPFPNIPLAVYLAAVTPSPESLRRLPILFRRLHFIPTSYQTNRIHLSSPQNLDDPACLSEGGFIHQGSVGWFRESICVPSARFNWLSRRKVERGGQGDDCLCSRLHACFAVATGFR